MTLSTVVNLFDPLEALPKHESWLRTVLLSRLGNRDEVEDVMQEVAVAAANQSARFVAVEQVGPWLYRVAIRQMLQFRRKAGRNRRLLLNAGQYQSLKPKQLEHQSPLAFLLHNERQEAVRSALSDMVERDRQLLMLKYVDGLSYQQIASLLGATPQAVQSRLHRARAVMRERLSTLIESGGRLP